MRKPARDRIGHGCVRHDPIVKATVYGRPSDPYVMVIDTYGADGSVTRTIIARGYVPAFTATVGFRHEAPK